MDRNIKADKNERLKVSITELKHAIHCLHIRYHHRCFISPRGCNPNAWGMLFDYSHYDFCWFFSGKVTSIEQFKDWLANTDAKITYVGEPLGDLSTLSKRAALNTIVTYCSSKIDDLCGGSCTVYNGGSTCLSAPNTKCLSATNNVGFCDRGGCGGSCNQFSSCGTRLQNNFCYTPGTASILVGTA